MPEEPLPAGWVRVAEPDAIRSERRVMLDDGRVLRIVEPLEGETVPSQIFDPQTGQWTETALQHHARVRDRSVTVTAEGWVHVSGGMSEREPLVPIAACELLKPATGVWYEMPPLPVPSYLHASVCARGRVFALGGKTTEPRLGTGLRDLTLVASWAPGEPAWTMLPEMPFATSSIRACVLHDDSILVWGYARESSSLRWDHVRWFDLDAIDNGSAVIPFADGFMTLGGNRTDEAHALVRSWTPDGGWCSHRDLPDPRKAACVVRLRDGRIAVLGGTQSARRWAAPHPDDATTFRREMRFDVPARTLFVEGGGDAWDQRPSPTLWNPGGFVLPDGRVFVHDITGSYLWTP